MKYVLHVLLLLVMFSATAQVQTTNIPFSLNSAEITAEDFQAIQQLISNIPASENGITITVIAYADSTGNASYNDLLSQKRMQTVLDALKTSGTTNYQIEGIFLGERTTGLPALAAHPATRSADIIIEFPSASKQETIKPKTLTLAEMLKSVGPSVQYFQIQPADSNMLVGVQGTVIHIPENSFDIPVMYANADVTLSLKEYYAVSDMVLAGLTTTSGNELLQSGGMIDLHAYVAGKEVRLKKDRKIKIEFNSIRKLGEMHLFNGRRKDDGFMDWELSNNNMSASNTFEYINILHPDYFRSKMLKREGCPYLFCGLREDLGMQVNAGQKSYLGPVNWTAYRQYISEMKNSFGVRNYAELKAAVAKWNKKSAEANKYIVETSNMGLMNCDRFLNTPVEERTKVLANLPLEEGQITMLVFPGFPALMSTNYFEAGKMGFNNIGSSEHAVLVAFKKVDNQLYLAMQSFTTGEETIISPEYVAVTDQELREKMQSLNTTY